MQEETKRVLLSLRKRLKEQYELYKDVAGKYSAKENPFTSLVDESYCNGITAGASVAISYIDEEIQGLGMSGKEEVSTEQGQEG